MTVKTPRGAIELLEVTSDILQPLRQVLPFGILEGNFPDDPSRVYAIVVQCGDDEMWAVKQQSIEVPVEALNDVYTGNAFLIASSLKRYLSYGFGGCLIVGQYIRRKKSGAECGVAYFGVPSKAGIEATEFPYKEGFDDRFGHGFTTMFTHFIQAFAQSSEETGIPYQPVIGLDIRPRSQLGELGFQFLLHGSRLFALKKTVSEQDPVWTAVRASGIQELYHLPTVPGQITEDQLPKAKGEG